MIRARISRFKYRAMGALGFKKRSALQAPAMAKRVIRCAVRRRSFTLYMAFLSWPFILIFLMAVAIALFLPGKPDVPVWLVNLQLWLAALLALTKAIDRILAADAAWKRRGR